MKNMYARIPIILLIALIIGFISCSDDKDEIVMTWTQINTNLQDEVRYLQFLSDDVGYAKVISFSGWGFKLTKTINGGSIWSDITFPLNQSEYAVVDFSFQNADTGYVILNSIEIMCGELLMVAKAGIVFMLMLVGLISY